MAEFLIVGKSDCPFLSKSLLLADKLRQSLAAFTVHTETVTPSEWIDWLQIKKQKSQIRDQNQSPMIWRQMIDRGGPGLLLGGYNEFCEYAKMYYNIEFDLPNDKLMEIVEEQKLTKIKEVNDALKREANKKPFVVTLIQPECKLGYQLLPQLLKSSSTWLSDQFDSIELNLVSSDVETLSGIRMELEDLACGSLSKVTINSYRSCHVLILCQDELDDENLDDLQRLYKLKESFATHEEYIKKVTVNDRIILTGPYKTMLAKLTEDLGVESTKIQASGLTDENKVRRLLSELIKENPSKIYDIVLYGVGYGFGQESYSIVSMENAKLRNAKTAINGPTGHDRKLEDILYDPKKIRKEINEISKRPFSIQSEVGTVIELMQPPKRGENITRLVKSKSVSGDLSECFILASGKLDDNGDFITSALQPTEYQQLADICSRVSRQERLVVATEDERQQILDKEEQEAREAEEAALAKIEALRKQAEQEKRLKEAQENREEAALETITEKHEPHDETVSQTDQQPDETVPTDQVEPDIQGNQSELSTEPIGDHTSTPDDPVVED